MKKPSIIYKHYIPHAIAGKISIASPLCAFAGTAGTETIQISESNSGTPAYAYTDARNPVISDNGRYTVFNSDSLDLVSDDNNFVPDVFVYDNVDQIIRRISVNTSGDEGNGSSNYPAAISADGRYIAFSSNSTNLDSDNPVSGLFIHDTTTDTTQRISESCSQSLDISADGSRVVYNTSKCSYSKNPVNGIFVYTKGSSLPQVRVDLNSAGKSPDGDSSSPSISADGNIVVFSSSATDLVADDTNGFNDIYIRDIGLGTTTRIMGAGGVEPNNDSKLINGAISDDDRYIAFTSDATNLVENESDNNSDSDVFVYDRETTQVSRIMNNNGTEPTGGGMFGGKTSNASISANGNFVSFSSKLDYEVIGESLTSPNIFLSDLSLSLGQTQMVSKSTDQSSSSGTEPRVSGAGDSVVFQSSRSDLVENDTNLKTDIFLHTVGTDTTRRINLTPLDDQTTTTATSQFSKDASYSELGGRKISADGRYIVFESDAINLVANDNNASQDVFIYDRISGLINRISETASGEEGNSGSYAPSISANGRYIVFNSSSINFSIGSGTLVYDTINKTFTKISSSYSSDSAPFISSDGQYVVYSSSDSYLVPDDTNWSKDIFLYNSGLTTRVNLGNTGTTEANGDSGSPSVSDDGRYVVFSSIADNLVANDTNSNEDIFVFDTLTKNIQRISVSTAGTEGKGGSYNPMISADGEYVVYQSNASNLVADDNNTYSDIFLYDMTNLTTQRINLGTSGEADNNSTAPYISSNGEYISYSSRASNLTTDTSNGSEQVYIYDRISDETRLSSINSQGELGNYSSDRSAVSDNGTVVAYSSLSDNLIPNDSNGPFSKDIFVTSPPVIVPDCSDTALTISDTLYTADTVTESETSISTSGSVVVPSGIDVTYNAPVITLSAGFHAQAGSDFTATAKSVSCTAGRPVSRQVSSELLQEEELTSSSFELEPQAIVQNTIPSFQQQLLNALNKIPAFSENQISLKFNADLLTFYHNDYIIYAAKPASDAQKAAQDAGLYINRYPANFVFSDNEGLFSLDFYGTPLYPDLLMAYDLKFETRDQQAQITIDDTTYEGYFDYAVKQVEKTGKDIPVFSISPSRIQITWPGGEQQTMVILE